MRQPTVCETYGVPAKRGMIVTVDGEPGKIARLDAQYIHVMSPGRKHSVACHPTWKVTYHTKEGCVTP